MTANPKMQSVWSCISPDGTRMDVLAASAVAAQEMAARRFKCKPEAVITRYRYSTGGRHVPERLVKP